MNASSWSEEDLKKPEKIYEMNVLLNAQKEMSDKILDAQWETKWREEKVVIFSLFMSCFFAFAKRINLSELTYILIKDFHALKLCPQQHVLLSLIIHMNVIFKL